MEPTESAEPEAPANARPTTPESRSDPFELILQAVPLMWLAVVAAGFYLVARLPLTFTDRPVPGVADLERPALVLLAGLIVTGIIGYSRRRAPDSTGGVPAPAPGPASEEQTSTHS
jgi:hypothetical protein